MARLCIGGRVDVRHLRVRPSSPPTPGHQPVRGVGRHRYRHVRCHRGARRPPAPRRHRVGPARGRGHVRRHGLDLRPGRQLLVDGPGARAGSGVQPPPHPGLVRDRPRLVHAPGGPGAPVRAAGRRGGTPRVGGGRAVRHPPGVARPLRDGHPSRRGGLGPGQDQLRGGPGVRRGRTGRRPLQLGRGRVPRSARGPPEHVGGAAADRRGQPAGAGGRQPDQDVPGGRRSRARRPVAGRAHRRGAEATAPPGRRRPGRAHRGRRDPRRGRPGPETGS